MCAKGSHVNVRWNKKMRNLAEDGLAIPVLSVYPKGRRTRIQAKARTWMIRVTIHNRERRKGPECPSLGERMNEMCSIQTMGCFSDANKHWAPKTRAETEKPNATGHLLYDSLHVQETKQRRLQAPKAEAWSPGPWGASTSWCGWPKKIKKEPLFFSFDI